MRTRPRSRNAGTVTIEFTFSTLFWVVLLMGLSTTGLNLIRSLQITHISRDAGHLYAYGLDFTQSGDQNLLIQLCSGLNVTTTGGNGVFLFSTVMYIDAAQCTASGLQANTTSCPNLGQSVFTQRLVVGNSSLYASKFGTPSASIVASDGLIATSDYLRNTSARAVGFTSLLPMTGGKLAYLTETYFSSPDFDWRGYMTNTGVYANAIF
ncbi:MAG: hypothetical protein U0Q18_28195 [Bryobacteraceae bacterium]